MTSRVRRIFVVVLQAVFSLSLHAALWQGGGGKGELSKPQNASVEGRLLPTALATRGEDGVEVIVQFRERPLFARGRAAIAADAEARAAAQASLEAQLDRFERDLRRIGLERRGAVSANAADDGPAPAIRHRFTRVFAGAAITASADIIDAVARLDYVASVHLDQRHSVLLDRSVPKIDADEVWATFGTRGNGVVVAILDTGIDYTHPLLGGGFGAGKRVIGGRDFINRDDDPMDDHGHGTHVAGIVGASGALTGVAPEVSFLAYKVLDEAGFGSDSSIIAGIEAAADPNGDGNPADHAHVANMSLGRPGLPTDPVTLAVETASAAGVIFCIATGNEGGFYTISTPANAPSAISVGATTVDDELADFTSKGPVSATYAIKPEVVAPGVGIVSSLPGGRTGAADGTSMATPHVAGVAALLRALHPDWTSAQIKAAIVGTAATLGNDVMAEGAGRVDALRAARADVLAVPSTISLGRTDVETERWTPSRSFTVMNQGTRTRTLAFRATTPRSEIAISFVPAQATLAPGESRTIEVRFDVDNVRLPAPIAGSLTYSGLVHVDGGEVPLHLPWAFAKAAVVVVTYDQDVPFEVFVFSTRNATVARAVADVGQRQIEVAVPEGEYDVKIRPYILRGSQDVAERFIMAEKVNVARRVTVALRQDMAQYEVGIQAAGPDGRDVEDVGRGNGTCNRTFIVTYLDSKSLAWSSASIANYQRFLVSTLSDRMTVTTHVSCIDFGTASIYSGQMPPIRGVNGPVVARLQASDWAAAPYRLTLPPASADGRTVLHTGFLWRGAFWNMAVTMGGWLPATNRLQGTVYLTTETQPLDAVAYIEVAMPLPEGQAGPPDVSALRTPPIRRLPEGFVLAPWLTPGPAPYRAREGDVLPLGEGLMYPESYIFVSGGTQLTTTYFHGSLDETRFAEALGARLTIRDEAGTVLRDHSTFIPPVTLPAGAYQFDLTKAFQVEGVTGEAHLTSRFDTRRADGAAPTMTGMRLLDGEGRVVTKLKRRSIGTLHFSVIDRVQTANGATRGYVAEEATVARWRPHGESQWRTLTSSIVAREMANGQEEVTALGHVPAGTVYRADLSDATRAGTSLIDLRLEFRDPAGNTYEYTLAPAFAVEETVRRRSVRQ